ncbi:hypothetical protein XTGART2_0919 [Xanthomonas translucens pv. graminis]|uniref:Secreted protein n=1 Tax=Xanthomonas graminis pv. graminis TaxID=134874 RepID=A0A1M4IDW3_9XANT|nr:hypothetical protein XTG29_00686 [Xanthomonas translucens pv. graminis ART-Xtg29]SBV40153.1 hypothetical protein XTGART2_0919 [Xanthomonas translucens pv. graminis]SBV40425.1 hypothetical protein XTGART9_0916 [Xanthomonas translucens pv. graminis]SBV46325.1 hypothetical protein XTGART29_0951 [Xanthomonas translucens pv. graminis ART-Xtg29]SBV54320.1 hypothetical protein XTGART10_0932 [Xanthomonas translucens pv. graminis]
MPTSAVTALPMVACAGAPAATASRSLAPPHRLYSAFGSALPPLDARYLLACVASDGATPSALGLATPTRALPAA